MLERENVHVENERSVRKAPLEEGEARGLLAAVGEVWVAKGRKLRRIPAADADLDDLRGPTGNFRAPMLRVGSILLVGFQLEALGTLLGLEAP